MANSTLYRNTPSFIALILMTCISFAAQAQDGFFKIYPIQGYHSMVDLTPVDNNNYAFITGSYFYRVDDSGNIKAQKEIKQGNYSNLEALLKDSEGNFWIAAYVSDDPLTSRRVLIKINADGQILVTVNLNDSDSFGDIQLVPSSSNRFFMAFQNRAASGNVAVMVYMMDKNGNKLWGKQASDTIYNNYVLKPGPNNSADIYYEHKNDRKGEVVNINTNGDPDRVTINVNTSADTDNYISDFKRLGDGFIFCGAQNKPVPLYSDGMIYKTNSSGDLTWIKKNDIALSDHFFRIEPVADGFIVLGLSGITNGQSNTEGDIVLLKLDPQGNLIWTKGFGSAKTDYARFLCMLDQQILFSGQTSYTGSTVTIPFLCKTDKNGELHAALPFQPERMTSIKQLGTPVNKYSAALVQSAPGPNGSILSGGNVLWADDDVYYPFVVCNDKTGKDVWFRKLSDYEAPLKLFKQIRPKEYIAVTEIKDLFANLYDVYLMDESGKIIWTKRIGASNIKDVIATHDGGMLFTGALDVAFVDYETLLIKLNAAGDLVWKKTIGDARVWETGRKIIETPEQDFLITGNVQTEFAPNSALYVLKIDREGNKRWSKTFSDGITTDVGYDLIITPDQQYLFAGSTNRQPFNNTDLLLIKTDKNGNLIWKKTIDVHLRDEGFQLINRAGGGFLLTGTTAEPNAGALEKFNFVMTISDAGNRTGGSFFGRSAIQTMNPCLIITSSGDTTLTGTTQEGYGKDFLFMAKLNDIPAEDPGGGPQDGSVKLYPNPSHGASILMITQPATGPVFVSIYDHVGKKIKGFYLEKISATLKADIVIPGLSAGVYYVNVWLNGKMVTVKWLVGWF